jgi:hypothetical protein
MDVDKNIANALGIQFDPATPKVVEIIPPEPKENVATTAVSTDVLTTAATQAQEDFEFVRTQLRALVGKGMSKLDEMGELSNELETARGYEVYSVMLEKISGLTKDLYDLHKKKKDLVTEGKRVDDSSITVEKAVFVGTAAEMLDRIQDRRKKE